MRTLCAVFFIVVVELSLGVPQRASSISRIDQLLARENIKGVASVRVESALFIAAWLQTPQDQTLEIYAMDKYPALRLIDAFRDRDVPWQSLTAIQDGAVAGFQVRRTAGEGWFGATLIYFYTDGKFKKVFESGEVAELLDLNGDGYPEALEYRGDKSDPSCRVKISVWKNDRYQSLGTVPLSQLFSIQTRNRIQRFLHVGKTPGPK